MSPLLKKETLVVKQILTLLILLAAVTVSGCLGLLWLRQKIELTAQATHSLENQIVKEERRLRYLDTKIAEIHQPLYLERQNRRLGLNLRPPRENQIVYMPGALPPNGVLADASEDAFDQSPGKEPFRRSIDLAVMDALMPID